MESRGKPPRVEVEWDDAASNYKQMSLNKARKECRCVRRFTLGYMIEKTRDHLIVAHTFDPGIDGKDGGADFTTVPRGWVKAIIVLEPAAAQAEKEGE